MASLPLRSLRLARSAVTKSPRRLPPECSRADTAASTTNASTQRGGYRLRLRVDFCAGLCELRCLLFQSFFERGIFRDPLLRRKLSYVLSYFHRAEMWSAHRAEVRGLGAFLRQRLVVKLAGSL